MFRLSRLVQSQFYWENVCQPFYISQRLFRCKSLRNVEYYDSWVHSELCKWENSGSWNTSSVFQHESTVIWKNTCVIMLIIQNTVEEIRLCQNRFAVLVGSHFVYANEDNAGSESFSLPFHSPMCGERVRQILCISWIHYWCMRLKNMECYEIRVHDDLCKWVYTGRGNISFFFKGKSMVWQKNTYVIRWL